MKYLLSILTILLFASCKPDATVDYVVISGKITNPGNGELTINTYDRSFREALDLSDEGDFIDTLYVKSPSYVLYDGQHPIFLHLEPGYNLNISYDNADFDNTLSITGTGAEANNYLRTKKTLTSENFGSSKDAYSMSEADFKAKAEKLKTSQDSLLNATDGLSEDFKTKEKRNINYAYLNMLMNYEEAHQYYTNNPEFSVSEGFLDEADSIDYTNEEDYLYSNDYQSMVGSYYMNKSKALAKKDSIENDMAYIKTVGAIESDTIKNSLLFDFANFNINYTKDLDAFYKSFMANSTNDDYKKIITDKYNELQILNPGNPSPKFVDYENYAGGTTSLDDLKGKYVYVDVWATWCGPCKREIPFLKEVEKQYHGKNIAFVSVSIDKQEDHDAWKAMVEDKDLGGIQLFADNDWKSKFVNDYKIQGIPRFILIDPEGNIVDATAPRPSNPELISLFNELNI
ncbi:TlpA family protein disulfide reductase [Gaetbulibacter aestuarii]|uniref:TlpA disulfide reductase family protein n=1 Tax=Gaetbulibacter aestuarii TaxID=1502358 RepID=A0ABW7N1V2_9FLAO